MISILLISVLLFGTNLFSCFAQQHHHNTYRVHFFHKPDGPWLSLLNLRIISSIDQDQHSLDAVDVDAKEDDDALDYDEYEDGWLLIEMDQPDWTVAEGRELTGGIRNEQDQNGIISDQELVQNVNETGQFENWTTTMTDNDKAKLEDRKDDKEADQEMPNNDNRPDLALFKDLILPWIPHRLRHHHHTKHSDKTTTTPDTIKTTIASGSNKNIEDQGQDKEVVDKGMPDNDNRPDLALFKDLILPWIPHRLRQHHHPHHLKHADITSIKKTPKTITESGSPIKYGNENAEMIEDEGQVNNEEDKGLQNNDNNPDLALFKDLILPWIPHRLMDSSSLRYPHQTSTPSTTTISHLPIFGNIATMKNEESEEDEEELRAKLKSAITEKDGESSDNMTTMNSTTSSQKAKITTPETTTTTTMAPINEEELALNLHADPMGREEGRMRAILLGDNETETEDPEASWEAYRDLGGSFILPLLKERNYDNRSIPLVYPDLPLRVAVSMEVLHLGNFDNFQMEYELDMLFHLRWADVRLSNNFSKPVRIRDQKIIDRIWKPDAVFLNSKFSYFHLVTFPNFRMRIMPQGQVNYTSRITLLPDCQMNFCNFPHDTQKCTLYISSIAHPKSMLEFHWDREPIVFSRGISMADLRIKHISHTECHLHGKLIPSSCLALTFLLKRDAARYVAERYLPSTLAMLFSWVAYYVPYNYEEVRIITPITVLLTLVQMERGNQEVITSYLTSLDIWFVVIKAFTVLSLIESLTVLAYIKRGRTVESQSQRAPNEYHRDLLQAEVKRIQRIYHRLDYVSRVASPLAFLCFLLYYVNFVAQSDHGSCSTTNSPSAI